MIRRLLRQLRLALILLAALFLWANWTSRAASDTLAGYTAFDTAASLPADGAAPAPGITASDVTRGPGLRHASTGSDEYASAGWGAGGDREAAEAAGRYLSWKIESDAPIRLTDLALGFRRGGHAPEHFQLELRTDGAGGWQVLHTEHVRNASAQEMTLDPAALGLDAASSFEFRLYAWGARRQGNNNNPGTVRLVNAVTAPDGSAGALVLGGTPVSAPDPADPPSSPHVCSATAPGQSPFLESGLPGGEFSRDHSDPTPVPSGHDLIVASGQSGRHDMLVLTDLPGGAQTLTLNFCFPQDGAASWAGGNVLFKTSPFDWPWDGSYAGSFALSPIAPNDSVTISLGPDFDGTLYLALYFTYGGEISWNLPLPTVHPPADIDASRTVHVHAQDGLGCEILPGTPPAAPGAAIPGACIEYRIALENIGGSVATDLSMVDMLAPDFIFVAAQAQGFGAAGSTLQTPPAMTDCATVSCEIRLEDGALDVNEVGKVIIRGLLK